MFEVIQADGQHLRFDDKHRWEYFAEESASAPDRVSVDRSIVRIWKEDASGDEVLVTTIFRPLRVDEVTEQTTLYPALKMRIGTKCVRCGHIEY